MTNIDFSTTRHEEITTHEQATPLLEEFMKDLENPEEAQKNAEALQANKQLLNIMWRFAKTHLDNTILSTYTINDDTEAKEMIAYHELQTNHPFTKMPPTEIERREQATEILSMYKHLNDYEQNQNMHLNRETWQLEPTPWPKTLPYWIDTIEPIRVDAGLARILDTFWLKDALHKEKKEHHLHKLDYITRAHVEHNPQVRNLRNQIDGKRKLWIPGPSAREKMSTIDKSAISKELITHYTAQPDQFNSITSYDQFLVKELFCALMKDAIYDPKKRDNTITYNDLQRDNWVSSVYGNNSSNVHVTSEKLESDNLRIENNKIINTVTSHTLDLNESTVQEAEKNRTLQEKNRTLTRSIYWNIQSSILQKHDISEEEYYRMEYEEWQIYQQEIQTEYLKVALTDTACFDATREEQYQQSNHNREISWNQWVVIDHILDHFNTEKIDLTQFNCQSRRTLLTATKNEKQEKVFQLQQWANTIAIGIRWVLTADIKAPPSNEELQNIQTNIDATTINEHFSTKSASELLADHTLQSPWLRRALHATQRPKTLRDGTKGIDRSGLDLTAWEITNLSKLLTQDTYVNQKLHLDISNNNLFNIPKSLLEQPNVQHLDLANNRISYLPTTTDSNLQSLNLNHNGAGNIYNINKLTKLESIHVDNNNLGQLPALPAGIQELTAANNSLGEVDFTSYTHLTKINLWNNKLTSLPDKVATLPLEELNIGDNKLTTFPEPIASKGTLKQISVSNNPLTEFPLTQEYPALKYGNFTNTNITSLPENIEKIAPNAEHITFFENILSGQQAKKQFLNGSLSRRWYDLTKGWAEQLQSLFEAPNTKSIKYAHGKWDDINSVEQHLKQQLRTEHEQPTVTIQKKNPRGWYSVYLFTAAQSPKDYINKEST